MFPNRLVKKMIDDFRAECSRKKSLYKYKLNVDVQKNNPVPYFKNTTKSIYGAHWLNNCPSPANSPIDLVHLTGQNAEKVAELHTRSEIHPHIVRVFGRVEHAESGILLLVESPATQTLAQLFKDLSLQLSMATRDVILHQIASALQYLTDEKIPHGHITAGTVFVDHLGELPQNTLVKLNTLEDTEALMNRSPPEMLSNEFASEKSDVYVFGLLAQELYSLELATENVDLIERQNLYGRCLAASPSDRPTLTELTCSLHNLILRETDIFRWTPSE